MAWSNQPNSPAMALRWQPEHRPLKGLDTLPASRGLWRAAGNPPVWGAPAPVGHFLRRNKSLSMRARASAARLDDVPAPHRAMGDREGVHNMGARCEFSTRHASGPQHRQQTRRHVRRGDGFRRDAIGRSGSTATPTASMVQHTPQPESLRGERSTRHTSCRASYACGRRQKPTSGLNAAMKRRAARRKLRR